jgi:uncharacterized protein YbjQ (UPF0145 family)
MAAFALFGCVENRNVPLPHSISEALGYENYRERLQGVQFYFGNQKHPPVEKSFGEHRTAQRASSGGRQSKESCARALASALLRLKAAAIKSGGDAVVNIKSNYRHQEVTSESHFQCATGVLMSGVALKGTVVKLRN